MDANHQHPERLPYDVVELIIDFASDPSIRTKDWRLPKRTLLVCALVCNTWLLHARRRLLSLYYKNGFVKLKATAQAFHKFHDVFDSPLCTLDPTFIRTLSICTSKAKTTFPLSTLLSILTGISLPSLRRISFHGIYPYSDNLIVEDAEEDGGTPYVATGVPQVTLPQVTELDITPRNHDYNCPVVLDFIVKTAQFFPYLESIAVFDEFDLDVFYQHGDLRSFPPPQSLRKLVVDTATFVSLIKWLRVCDHTAISSISLRGAEYVEERVLGRLMQELNTLVHGLEELEIGMDSFIF